MAQSMIRDSGLEIALNILHRRKWSGFITFVATLSLAVPFALFLPNVYRGVTTVIVENQDASSVLRVAVPELETRLVTIQQELLSRARLTDLIVRFNLYSSWRKQLSMEAIVERMRRDIHIELSRTDRDRPTTIGLKISYVGVDRESAAAVPNALAALYVDENTRIREQQSSEMAEFLRKQVEAARAAVDVQQARINRFKEEHVGQLPEQVSINMVTLERLNTRLRLNTDDQLRIRELQDRLAATASVGYDAPDRLQNLKQRLAELQSKYTDQHPDVIRAKAEIAELEQQRSSAALPPPKRPISTTEGELASLQREERTLRSEIAEYEERIQSAPKVEQQLEALQRDYSSAKESYGSILKRYEEAQLADNLEQAKKPESFRILDRALVPAGPAAPNRLRLFLMALFFATACAVGMMLLREHLDTSFHTVGELRQFTTVPILASIPHVPSRTTLLNALRLVLSIAAVALLCVLLAGFAYKTAQHNTQLVWMLSAPQI